MTLRFLNLSKSNPNFLVLCRRTCLYVCVACARALVCARRTLHAEMSSSKYEHCSVNHSKMDRLHLMTSITSKAQARHALTLTNPVKILQYNSQVRNYCITHWPNTTFSQDPNETFIDLLDYMKTSAAYKVGELKRRNSTQHTAGPTVTELLEHQRAPKLKIYQHSKSKDRATLQKGRNNILWLISKRLKEVAVEEGRHSGRPNHLNRWLS